MSPKFTLRASLLALVVAGLGTAATAQSFNGPYVGAQIGWQHDRGSLKADNPGGGTLSITDSTDAFVGGGFMGYDATVGGNLVLGGEVGLDFGGTHIDGFDAKGRRTITVTGRAGMLMNPQTLLYARGGYSNGRFRFGDGAGSFSDNRDGWLLGAGVERALTPNMSARVEYRYSDFGDLADIVAYDRATRDVSVNRHQVLLGVSYRF